MSLKEKIYEMIKERPGTSFVELETIEGVKGEYAMTTMHHLILWHALTMEAIDALKELMKEKKIECDPTTVLTYAIDGYMPNLPVIKSAKNVDKLKKDYWLPVTFKPLK